MKLMNLNYEREICEEMITCVEDYGLLNDPVLSEKLSKHYNKQVEALYIVEGDDCGPRLMAEWSMWLGEEEQYDLLPVTFSSSEEALFYRLRLI